MSSDLVVQMSSDDQELDLSSDEVVNKYQAAAEIVNEALKLVLSECKPGASIVDLCEKGDNFITEQAGTVSKNGKIIGSCIAFPTCLSVNNIVCHFSPLSTCDEVVEENDMVKVDMGCHVDGFTAMVAHTYVIKDGPVTGRAADVLAAANAAAEAALRMATPGKKNKDVAEAIQKAVAAYNCKILERVSQQLERLVIDGNNLVLTVSNADTRVDDAEFEENKVYAIDIITSIGNGKPKTLSEEHTTIYKRAVDKDYQLKMKSSICIFREICKKFPFMPFTLRALEYNKRQFFGLTECLIHELLQPYPVLYEKQGDLVAHIKFTVLLMRNGSNKITSHPLQDLQPSKSNEDN